jgi:hypothetical protein
VSGFYGGGYSSYSTGTRLRGSATTAYGVYDPYNFGSPRTSTFGYPPHYYRSDGLGHTGSITLGLGYDPLHRSSLFGRHRYSQRYGSLHGGYSFEHGIGHRGRHWNDTQRIHTPSAWIAAASAATTGEHVVGKLTMHLSQGGFEAVEEITLLCTVNRPEYSGDSFV